MSATELKEIDKKNESQAEEERREAETDDPETHFIQPNHSDVKVDVGPPPLGFTGLSKDELMQFANDPFWRKVRLVLFILFWVVWVAMLVAAIIIIIFTPKCPSVPKQTFWQKKPGYLVDVSKFKDTDGNGIGDIKGIIDKLDYLGKKSGFIVLQSIIAGSLGTNAVRSPGITNFMAVDERVGTMDDVKKLLKSCRRNDMKAIIEFHPVTGMTHEWFDKAQKNNKDFQKYYIWSDKEATSSMVNRVGASVWNKASGSNYYWSSLHKSIPALNLTNGEVLTKLKEAVQFWLNLGFDGIFIDDVSFLAPEIDTTGNPTAKDIGKWYKKKQIRLLNSKESCKFVREVRSWVDEVKEKSDRERLFLVSSGNTGFRQEINKTLSYLGDSTGPGAHSVIVYNLVDGQGDKVNKNLSIKSLKLSISAVLEQDEGKIMFVTQEPSGPRSADATKTFFNLLLPGSQLSIYGEEIGMKAYNSLQKTSLVPNWYLTKAAENTKYANDVVDRFNIPMQWTSYGGFSNFSEKIMVFKDANVMSMSTIGRGKTRFNIFEELVALRKEPSLNWGKFKWIEEGSESPAHYIFTRSAEGFSKYVAVLIEPTTKKGGITRDLSKLACAKAEKKLAFPFNREFDKMKELDMKNIYFSYGEEGSVFVFKCIDS